MMHENLNFKGLTPSVEALLLACGAGDGLEVGRASLLMGAQVHPAWAGWKELSGWQPLKPLADAWDRAGLRRVEEITGRRGAWSQVLVLPGKSRDETLGWFGQARQCLAPGGTLVVSMPNTAGAGRFEKELARATAGVTSIQKHKCRAFMATDDGSWDESLFAEWATLGEEKQIEGSPFVTCAGIFSSEHIDPGSQFLADHLPAGLHGRVADLGAGWGFLTEQMLRKCPHITCVDLYEADARALACARRNLSHYDGRYECKWHDVTTGIDAGYDVIVSNPPFHTGQAADVGLGRAFLTNSAIALKRGGRMFVVANRQLPYEGVLEATGLAWRKTAENRTYKIFTAEKRRS